MEFFKSITIWQKRIVTAFIGGIAGYAYYHFIGCASGTCAITSNPYISTAYGILVGALLIAKPKNEKKEIENGNNNSSTGKEI
ncbi:MAG: hypothetical protein PHP42_01820 [Bacteroidota bacterium]|nr:hypothetical protein [Bacteroidota bacterium]